MPSTAPPRGPPRGAGSRTAGRRARTTMSGSRGSRRKRQGEVGWPVRGDERETDERQGEHGEGTEGAERGSPAGGAALPRGATATTCPRPSTGQQQQRAQEGLLSGVRQDARGRDRQHDASPPRRPGASAAAGAAPASTAAATRRPGTRSAQPGRQDPPPDLWAT